MTTRDEDLIASVKVLLRPSASSDGLSTADVAESLGIGEAKAAGLLRKLFREGRLITQWKPRMSRNGYMRRVPLYSISPSRTPASPSRKAASRSR